MAFIRGIIGFAFAGFLTLFAVFNRHDVALSIGPYFPSLELPLYLIVLVFMAVGFVFGGLYVWMNGASVRRGARKQRKKIKALEREVDGIRAGRSGEVAPYNDFFPALPARKKG